MKKMLAAFIVVASSVLSGKVYARSDVVILQWPTDNKNNLGATALVDSVGSVTGRDDATKTSLRTGVVDLRLTTGDSTTGITLSAYNETGTRIIDASTPVRGLRFYLSPTYAGATHFVEGVGSVALVGLSVYGKTAANLRQGYFPVTMGQPLVIENVFWYNTTGASVSVFIECNNADAALQNLTMQVIR